MLNFRSRSQKSKVKYLSIGPNTPFNEDSNHFEILSGNNYYFTKMRKKPLHDGAANRVVMEKGYVNYFRYSSYVILTISTISFEFLFIIKQ